MYVWLSLIHFYTVNPIAMKLLGSFRVELSRKFSAFSLPMRVSAISKTLKLIINGLSIGVAKLLILILMLVKCNASLTTIWTL